MSEDVRMGKIKFFPDDPDPVSRLARLRKTGDDPVFRGFRRRQGYNAGGDLAVVGDDDGVVTVLIEAAKKKGVRLLESDFEGPDAVHLNQHVMILRGKACDLVHRIFNEKGAE